jgi:hypothetical protein
VRRLVPDADGQAVGFVGEIAEVFADAVAEGFQCGGNDFRLAGYLVLSAGIDANMTIFGIVGPNNMRACLPVIAPFDEVCFSRGSDQS